MQTQRINANFHSHTLFSDGKAAPEKYADAAIEKGFNAYAFTDHAPLPFDCHWCIKPNELNNYIESIKNEKQRCEKLIEIYCGLEVDYIPQIISTSDDVFKNPDFDFLIGSLHFLCHFSDQTYWDIASSAENFKRGLYEIFGNNAKALILKYYETMCEMIENHKFTILGHIDMIKMHNHENCLFSESDLWYKKAVHEVLECAKSRNLFIEINTRGWYKKRTKDFYPSFEIMKQISGMKIPIVLNSDTHQVEEIDVGFKEASLVLKTAGIALKMILSKGKWIETPV